MRVLICHERFIARFGADRVLLILARRLREAGAHVTLMGARFDNDLLSDAADEVIITPLDVVAPQLEERTLEWLCSEWANRLAIDEGPELVSVGGWPFFTAIPLFRTMCRRILFIDCGVVPEDGYSEGHRQLLRRLVALRKKFLPYCTHISANSRFTLESQSLPQAGPRVDCAPVLNGVDHLQPFVGSSLDLSTELEARLAVHRRNVLLLGRFEPVGYKNSGAAFEVLEQLLTVEPSTMMLVLEPPDRITVPASLEGHVVGIGYPDDRDLLTLMRRVDLGLSVSRWEGFNLPLAEMFWLGKPALAFNLAAHPEVVPDPWFLADDVADMAAKAAWLLQGGSIAPALDAPVLAAYRQRFTWDRFVEETVRLVGFDTRLLPSSSITAA
jgi:glycosyltransferase involved in cell wall biosynthesis